MSSSWRQLSALLATFRRMSGGAIPASANKQGIGVAFKQPVIMLHVSFRAISTCQVCLERPHEEQAKKSGAKTIPCGRPFFSVAPPSARARLVI